MACKCGQNRVNKTASQLRREALRAEREAQKQTQKQEDQDEIIDIESSRSKVRSS